jgi:hypothetical protein
MRSRYQPDGSIDYDADRALEILRHADEELARRHQAQQEEVLRMTTGDHWGPDMVTKTPSAAAAGVMATFPGMPEDPLHGFLNSSPMDLLPNPLPIPTPGMTTGPTTTNQHTN